MPNRHYLATYICVNFYRTTRTHSAVWPGVRLSHAAIAPKQLNRSSWFSLQRLYSAYPALFRYGIWVSPNLWVT